MLAASLGARVAPGPAPEVGVLEVVTTAASSEDPVFLGRAGSVSALQWHTDTWELPAGAVQLARSEAFEQQAFSFKRAYGLQFHIEVSAGLAAEWGEVPAYATSLDRIMGAGALPRLVAEIRAREAEMVALARGLFAAWLARVVGLPAPALVTD